jgi:hypothetical protein
MKTKKIFHEIPTRNLDELLKAQKSLMNSEKAQLVRYYPLLLYEIVGKIEKMIEKKQTTGKALMKAFINVDDSIFPSKWGDTEEEKLKQAEAAPKKKKTIIVASAPSTVKKTEIVSAPSTVKKSELVSALATVLKPGLASTTTTTPTITPTAPSAFVLNPNPSPILPASHPPGILTTPKSEFAIPFGKPKKVGFYL